MRLVNPQNAINTPGVITADLKLSLKMQNKIKEKDFFFNKITKRKKNKRIREKKSKEREKEHQREKDQMK